MPLSAKKKSFKATIAILVALVTFMQTIEAQTTITMPLNGSRTDTLHAGSSYSLLDPGGSGDYPSSCFSSLTIVSDSGTAITISGMLQTDYSYAFLHIYEGANVNRPITSSYSGLKNVNVTLPTGIATLIFSSTNASSYYGFQFTISVCDVPEGIVRDVTVSNPTPDSVTLDWSGNHEGTAQTGWTVSFGTSPNNLDNTVATSNPNITLSGLSPNTTYYYSVVPGNLASSPCSYIVKQFRTTCTEPHDGGIDYSNLHSCYVKATYGTFTDPMQQTGIVDSGSSSHLSRHTVHTDTSERDPRSGNQLLTIPPGYSSSVRLGNWNVNSQAETITYEYRVDTNYSDLLIMKYAALLQVPNHNTVQRPRFKFQIFDENECEINSDCYSADFVANTELGWNVYDPYCFDSTHLTTEAVLWKDWTTVGIDLTPLHGQTIMIRLSTYDCAHGQHYGYAYFVIDCNHKTIVTENCGCQIENTFTVPEGFSYRWYKADSVGTNVQSSPTLSNERSLHVTQPGVYRCQLSFIGSPAGASCSFEMQAIAGERYPAAIMDIDSSRTNSCDLRLDLHNNSLIATDSLRHHLTSLPCDEGQWIVDGQPLSTATDDSVTLSPGNHTIQLVASLSNGSCTDTATLTIHVADLNSYSTVRDTIVENQLPYSWNGHFFENSILDSTFIIPNAVGCDSTISYSLHVWPNVQTLLDSTICDTGLPLVWNGITFDVHSPILNSQFTLTNCHGADSTVTMTLHVNSSSHSLISDTIVENQLPYTWNGHLFENSILDSTFIIPNAVGCDSTINYSLHVWSNVQTLLDSTVCDTELPLLWNGHTFDGDSSILFSQFIIPNSHGADSTVSMTLHVLSSSQSEISDTIVENQLPYSWNGHVFNNPTHNSTFIIQNFAGCDSTISYSLHVWPNVNTSIDSMICADQLPFQWHDHVVTDMHPDTIMPILQSGIQSLSFIFQYSTANCHGADSTVILTLTIHPVYNKSFSDTICDDVLPYNLAGHTLFSGIHDSTLAFHTINGCDSSVSLNLTVYPTHRTTLYDTLCDNQLPYIWEGITFNDSIRCSQFTIPNLFGCDSTVSLSLTVHPTHRTYHRAVVCNGVPYHWIDGNTYNYSTYSPHIDYLNIYGCDSILHLLLDLDDNFRASMEVAPTTVDLDHPTVRLRDRSESHSRQWFVIDRQHEDEHLVFVDTARISHFLFPADRDSLSVLMVASTMAGCVDSVWGVVNSNRAVVWAPNAITPDEPQNNRFAIISNQLASGEVWIYNRAGLLITHFDALSGSWDGSYRGNPCPQATYTWVIKYTTILQPRQTHSLKGTVTLLR